MADFVHVEHATIEPSLDDNNQDRKAQPQDKQLTKPDLSFLDSHPFVRQVVLDKVYGCIIGSALGDTIGLYTEFLPKQACEQIYKDGKFSLVDAATELYNDSHRNRFEPRAWTDDTDQALLILLSYLHLYTHRTSDIFEALPQEFAHRAKIWISQGLIALGRPPAGIGNLLGGVVSRKDYLSDPIGTATERWIKTARQVAPNGSLMRTHPIGVICVGLEEEEAWRVAVAVGNTTHIDPRCTVACCISVGLIRGILRGEIVVEEDVDKAIESAYAWVLAQPELMNPGLSSDLTTHEIVRHLDRKEFERHVYAKSLEELKLDSKREMGYVYKCLGSSILTLRLGIRATKHSAVAPNGLFEELITTLIMEGGDSDTNGAAAGALLGVWLGYSNLPAHWTNGLAHKEWLVEKVEKVTKAVKIIPGEVREEKDEERDGGKGLMSEAELEKRDRDMMQLILKRGREKKDKDEREKKQQGIGIMGWFKR